VVTVPQDAPAPSIETVVLETVPFKQSFVVGIVPSKNLTVTSELRASETVRVRKLLPLAANSEIFTDPATVPLAPVVSPPEMDTFEGRDRVTAPVEAEAVI
jgi:hypothetical protein